MIKPFFLKCHPDVQPTVSAKRINLQALQTINGLLDVTQATCQGRVVEWPNSVEIQFLITIQEQVKKDVIETTSRRRVELMLPPSSLRNAVVQTRDARAIQQLHRHVQLELAKLLKVAGLPVPVVLENNDSNDALDSVWNEELQGTVSPSTSRYEQSRRQFVQNVDWKRIHRMTHEAVADMKADLATEGSVQENAQRRQAVITNILAKVRVEQGVDIPMVEQLICFRRLSLILEDNFEELYMEDMGRMWENLIIVLTGPRDYNTSSSAMRKRTKRAQETGYQFSYSASGVVTIHIPIEFGDEELVAQLDRNLWDFYNIVGNGVEELYPKWFLDPA